LIILLTQHEIEYNKAPEEYYYKLRDNYNIRSCSDRIERAAQFITLNKTCYNGLYRVNGQGLFNAPWGKYIKPLICDATNLRNVSQVLNRNSKVTIRACDYKEMLLENAKEGDFIYLDPPYIPVSATANFRSYTKDGFSYKDHEALAEMFRQLDEMKCKVMRREIELLLNNLKGKPTDEKHLTEYLEGLFDLGKKILDIIHVEHSITEIELMHRVLPESIGKTGKDLKPYIIKFYDAHYMLISFFNATDNKSKGGMKEKEFYTMWKTQRGYLEGR
jgi:hypothetical protein